jgi:ubiquinone/menaquinone biosynthesis C-methylase UbiE
VGSSKAQGMLWRSAAQDWAGLFEPTGKPLWVAMLDSAEVDQGKRLLDLGCGGGGASVLAAKRGAHVAGLDAAEALIEIARERLPGGDFCVGDLEQLPLERTCPRGVVHGFSGLSKSRVLLPDQNLDGR